MIHDNMEKHNTLGSIKLFTGALGISGMAGQSWIKSALNEPKLYPQIGSLGGNSDGCP